ncbi:MAG: hypothetical protein B6I20_03650 [Bacteroidetes bacterium 4572_117]|nr:MAG: hypothetical protein B6I20_03650 [Bacteroidetes bacterium 4572_117]
MGTIWLNKTGNKNCILFFNGWGMDENAVNHLSTTNFDVCMFGDYCNNFKIKANLSGYDKIYVVAWSLGVWASAKLLSQTPLKITKAIALNGTQQPIDDNQGILPQVFTATLNGWSERNRNKFNMRMMGGRDKYMQFKKNLGKREIQNQKDELSYILKEVNYDKKAEMNFDCALIGSNDLIFTPDNQFNYWNSKTRIIKTNVPHYPFTIFTTWDEIIEL